MFSKKKKNKIIFLCLNCNIEFDCDVGQVNFEPEMPEFGHPIVCERCGAKHEGKGDNFTDNFELTEMGQSQLTALFLNEG